MYSWLWRHLPGDTVTRVYIAVVGLLVVGVLLWYVVFPWFEPQVQFDHGTVDDGGTSATAPPTPAAKHR
ncbi:hypothetical protein [Actinoallomurus soli]|uniref:hypothetical protein n=1 Tax=Actinoallomurus soli TaxID=2952535 RepID=UPI0020938E36|nr:hypothetical protein [Actinoallomurus soli]MCO5970269.1 hypothetical protein [Actinoallomurus soli]